MDAELLKSTYERRYESILCPLADRLRTYLCGLLAATPRIDNISARAKAPPSFLRKAQKTEGSAPKYSDPLHQIQDQIGARVTAFYLADVEAVRAVVERFLGPIESRRAAPEAPSEFGYEGHHYLLFVPDDVLRPASENPNETPRFFELQIKTLFQHAWSQASHDLAYKPAGELSLLQRRQVAFTAAQAWGADQIFDQLASSLDTSA